MVVTKETFAEQLKDALLHLYDVAYLPQLELTRLLIEADALSWDERAQALRRLLLQAIERLDPGLDLPIRARERRSYAILSGRYARSMTSQELMDELAISERQYWREHKKAIEALVDLLWEDYATKVLTHPVPAPAPEEQAVIAREEAELMASHSNPEQVNLGEIIRQVGWALQKMMESKEVHLQIEMPDPPPLAFADRTVLRQVCLNLLSYAFDASEDGTVLLQAREQPEAAQFTVKTATQPGGKTPAGRTGLGLNVVRQLVEAQGGSLHIQTEETALWSATVDLPKAQRLSILVVDDNSAIINLFQRYLARSKYKVVGAETGQKALQLASQIKPAAITLDVMMPSQDGWETLQALKAMPELQGTPVIVCSILNEPDLAYALGADDFLRKPISQTSLLQTLDRWLARSSGGTPMRPGAPADSETAQPG